MFEVYLIKFTDAGGFLHEVPFIDPYDNIIMEGVAESGEQVSFESEAYHARGWLKENGFTFKLYKFDIDTDHIEDSIMEEIT